MDENKKLLEGLDNQVTLAEELPQKMIMSVIALMKGYEIKRLALWSGDFIDCYDDMPGYNEEDENLFGELEPSFSPNLDQGGNEDQCNGRIVAVELNNRRANPVEKLQLVCTEDDDAEVFRMNAVDAISAEDTRIDFNDVMKAVLLSIQFNLDNDIPVEKWGVCHHPNVDPYTYEYAE